MIAAALARYRLPLDIAMSAALAAGAIYGAHLFLERERDIGRNEVRAEYAKQLADAKDAALARERALQTQVNEANKHATEREQTIRSLAAASARTANGLRDTIAAIRDGLPAASSDALRNSTRTYGELLAACDSEQRSMAQEAERANSEKRTLIEAWPNEKAAH